MIQLKERSNGVNLSPKSLCRGDEMNVLFATDGSEYSEGAARFLTKFNISKGDTISVFHAISWIPVMSEYEHLYADFSSLRKEVAPRILESTADILKVTGANIETAFAEDYPDKAIVERAVEIGADIIVMGARGLRGIGSHLVGSITRAVSIKSPKPVLVIKPEQWAQEGNLKVLFATDGSDYADEVATMLASLPFPVSMELTILHVVFSTLMDIPERYALEVEDRIKKLVATHREQESRYSDEILDRAFNILQGTFPEAEKLRKYGDPSVEILDTAGEIGADIIALGSSGKRGVRAMLGSVSRYVLNHSKCSVLIGKS
jgi:nucleotide-binding universal stress UspA family protein